MEGRMKRRLRRALALTGAVTTGLLMFGASPASAAVSCIGVDTAGDDHIHVILGAAGDTATVSVGTGVNLGRILVNGSPCGTATVNNFDVIEVVDTAGGADQTLVIDLAGGPFAPGLTDEAGTTDELEWDIEMGAGTGDEINILGTSGNDTIVFGDTPGPELAVGIGGATNDDSFNLTGDEDADAGISTTAAPSGAEVLHVDGGLGNDVLSGNGGAGTGNPIPVSVTLHGQEGNDDLFGGAGGDFIGQSGNLEPGDDHITGGDGVDILIGGDPAASDLLDYSRETTPAPTQGAGVPNEVTLQDGTATDTADDSYGNNDTHSEFENVDGNNHATSGDRINGNSAANLINGNDGPDELEGRDGNDTINGGAGDDYIEGEDGDDLADGGTGNDIVSGGHAPASGFAGPDGNDTVLGGEGNDEVRGQGGNDSVEGGPGNDDLGGGPGNDILKGGDGDDNINSGPGADNVFPGLGTDSAFGDSGFDTVDYKDIPGPVEGNLNLGFVNGASTDSISSFEAFNGTAAGDTITGGGGATTSGVVIRGKQGNDTLTGTDGVDLLLGGKGDDTMSGLSGGDTQRGNDGNDNVRDAGGDDLVAGGGGNDTMRGGSGDDLMRGNGGNDNLKGGSGDDILNGGTGFDTCNGGDGDDSERSCEV